MTNERYFELQYKYTDLQKAFDETLEMNRKLGSENWKLEKENEKLRKENEQMKKHIENTLCCLNCGNTTSDGMGGIHCIERDCHVKNDEKCENWTMMLNQKEFIKMIIKKK